jgi:hypothetical protein
MSLSALRNSNTAGNRGFAPRAGVEAAKQPENDDATWRRGGEQDRSDARTTASSTVALEPHWQASIEIATD